MMSSTEAMISLTVWWRCVCVRSSGLAMSKSLGVNSRAYICGKNLFPRFLPNLLCKHIVISLPIFFDLPSQRITQPAVSGIG